MPLVVASQFPLSMEGSVPLVRTLYQGLLWGDHPLLLLQRVRAELHARYGYGDRDRDGLQEYATRSSHGYYNQGWKDAGEAIVMADGSLATLPIATCELQGYVYDAKLRMGDIYEILGRPKDARRLRREARVLFDRVNERMWWEEEGTYALGLDGSKKQIRSVASNAGVSMRCQCRPNRAAAPMASTNTGTIPSKTLRESALHLSGFRQRGFRGTVEMKIKSDVSIGEFMHRKNLVVGVEEKNTGNISLVVQGGRLARQDEERRGQHAVHAADFLLAVGDRVEACVGDPKGALVAPHPVLEQAQVVPRRGIAGVDVHHALVGLQLLQRCL